jgi:NAD(P)-dependent dehydrogenase (short-subunit alcohol dehydrogenase family)
VKRLASEVSKHESGGIHLLVNNAGIARDDNTKYSKADVDFSSAEGLSEHLLKSEPENWQETFLTNITSQYFVSAAFLPLLAKAKESTPGFSSSVVNITSISGVMKGSSGGQFAYATSKAGKFLNTKLCADKLINILRLHSPHAYACNYVHRAWCTREQHRARSLPERDDYQRV